MIGDEPLGFLVQDARQADLLRLALDGRARPDDQPVVVEAPDSCLRLAEEAAAAVALCAHCVPQAANLEHQLAAVVDSRALSVVGQL